MGGSGRWRAGFEQAEGGISLDRFLPDEDKKYALIFGHEIYGVEEAVMEKVHMAIEVPQSGTKHSLNISVCAGIVIWELWSKMHG